MSTIILAIPFVLSCLLGDIAAENLKQFHPMYGARVANKLIYRQIILTGLAVDGCATACVEEDAWICNSFSYCYDTGYCTLTAIQPLAEYHGHKNRIEAHQYCDLYIRKYSSLV
jgi:hypothetical protein